MYPSDPQSRSVTTVTRVLSPDGILFERHQHLVPIRDRAGQLLRLASPETSCQRYCWRSPGYPVFDGTNIWCRITPQLVSVVEQRRGHHCNLASARSEWSGFGALTGALTITLYYGKGFHSGRRRVCPARRNRHRHGDPSFGAAATASLLDHLQTRENFELLIPRAAN